MRREVIAVLVVWVVVCLPRAGAKEAAKPLLGDESDGSRARPIHLIPLFAENEDDAKGGPVDPNAELPLPFSTRWTCGECHSYGVISRGWHFNAMDSNVPAGRPGEPWLYFNSKLGIQLPLSYRPWPGAFAPNDVGLTPSQFTRIFGRHMPGGGPGEVTATELDGIAKQYVSGKLEVNCLACHNAHPGQDQGSPTGYAVQVSRENYRWAATASCEFADVTGSVMDASPTYDPFMADATETKTPHVRYDKRAFDQNGNVFLQIVREVPNYRCYYCHSDLYYGEGGAQTEKWSVDEDVHVTVGLKCVDCHRNGLRHDILRGSEDEAAVSENALAGALSCRGCHLGQEDGKRPQGGRLGAPVPLHAGLPPIHLERLSCTACHSGPWPSDATTLVKTSRAHRLGTPNVTKDEQAVPHVFAPVFATETVRSGGRGGAAEIPTDGKITPHKLIWPAYWGRLDGARVKPLALETVEKTLGRVLAKVEPPANGGWAPLTDDQVAQALQALAGQTDGKAAYVAGGQLYRLDEAGKLVREANYPAAAPYLWPLAHRVRPAAQALGSGGCTDCHAENSPFFFGKVAVDSPVASQNGLFKSMMEMSPAPSGPVYVRVNRFFKILIVVVMALLILHILGDLYRRALLRLSRAAGSPRPQAVEQEK